MIPALGRTAITTAVAQSREMALAWFSFRLLFAAPPQKAEATYRCLFVVQPQKATRIHCLRTARSQKAETSTKRTGA